MLKKKIKLLEIFNSINLEYKVKKNIFINGVNNLSNAKNNEISFCKKPEYIEDLKKTNASVCIVNKNFLKFVPKKCYPIISANPEIDFIKICNLFYSDYVLDKVSNNFFTKNEIKNKFKNIFFGKNFLCEKNVKLGKNIYIGHNVIIKNNSIIKDNVNIGDNVIISHSIIEKNVNICDGAIIGKKGFGFKFVQNKLLRIPHIGKVIIGENSEIGSNCNIDRGSIDDTIIGSNTILDNQIQIAHNVKIGNYCMIAAQVGISGSTKIGNSVSIGGQAGIAGHLKIGNNVKIGGKSGVLKDIEDNKTVIGYPAVDFRKFIKQNYTK